MSRLVSKRKNVPPLPELTSIKITQAEKKKYSKVYKGFVHRASLAARKPNVFFYACWRGLGTSVRVEQLLLKQLNKEIREHRAQWEAEHAAPVNNEQPNNTPCPPAA